MTTILVYDHALLGALISCVGPLMTTVLSSQPLAESVPYGEAVANRRVLLSSTESREGLAQQVRHWEHQRVW